jgi:hypothetical protein
VPSEAQQALTRHQDLATAQSEEASLRVAVSSAEQVATNLASAGGTVPEDEIGFDQALSYISGNLNTEQAKRIIAAINAKQLMSVSMPASLEEGVASQISAVANVPVAPALQAQLSLQTGEVEMGEVGDTGSGASKAKKKKTTKTATSSSYFQ